MTDTARLTFRQKVLIAAISVPAYLGVAGTALAVVAVNEARLNDVKEDAASRSELSCEVRNDFREMFDEVFTRIDRMIEKAGGDVSLHDQFSDLLVDENCDAIGTED